MAKSRSLSLVEASASKCGEISTIKCVLLGLLGADRSFSLSTMRRASVSIRLSCKAVTVGFEVAGDGLPPRKMMGIDSEGMLISAVHEENGHEGLNLLMVDSRIPAGAKLY